MKKKFSFYTYCILLTLVLSVPTLSYAVREENEEKNIPESVKDTCDGIFLSYDFLSREKEYPHVKNASAQPWAFKSTATVLNAGSSEIKAWKIFIEFQNEEILVSANGAVIVEGEDFPAFVGKGVYLAGYPVTDLKSAIETASDLNQIQVVVELTGTMFGLKPSAVPLPKSIRLENDGYKCPEIFKTDTSMCVCCVRDTKSKVNRTKSTRFLPRLNGDLSISYDIIQAQQGSYLAEVTIDNLHPLGRLDRWNLTWEWMRGEFVNTIRGAYTHKRDYSDCIYGPSGQYYKDLDFSTVTNCEKRPVFSDLPPERAHDPSVGNLPYCCRNGIILPSTMDPKRSRSAFQIQVFKIPPDMNRTSLYAPQKWAISGVMNPHYLCGAPMRVDPAQFPDPAGLDITSFAMASWQVVCNITKTKKEESKCCVSFSAYYNDSIIPCNTCACGCSEPEPDTCDAKASPLLLPYEALLVPFQNRTSKAKAWASLKHHPLPSPLPCPDNCGVSINWHISTDYRDGWTARITLFNWGETPLQDWFTAVQIPQAYQGYENVYSFNGTRLPEMNRTLFFQGMPGSTYLTGERNGSRVGRDPMVPGKQQSVVSFKKGKREGVRLVRGDGFPTKVLFNGEECSLPLYFPSGAAAAVEKRLRRGWDVFVVFVFVVVMGMV